MKEVLGFKFGVYYCEFHWKNYVTNQNDFHVVAVNCDQRHVFCNTLGVIPFATGNTNESKATHAKVCKQLRNPSVNFVYRIVQRKMP